ncbi:MAG: ABC transporter ATP-binding protein/permease [Gammaproteobacteria bacterium]|nr:ABC transporter ATP-binding protein/permease [Gammaproteobacteria bacterium]MDH5275194.1 ABC transporter ATP-binding protein/permease [Gammaproteobacteria bacterium]
MSVEATAGELPVKITNFQIMRRLLRYMTPFNAIMFTSLLARVTKIVAQAGVLGIAAASVGIYIGSAEPGVVNWDVLWEQVKWIAIVGTIVGFASYIENYTGHYVAFRILAAFRDRFYYAMLPLAPARTAKLQSGDAVSRVMTDCERVEPFYAHTIAPAVAAISVPVILLTWCYSVHPTLLWALMPFYIATTFVLPWLVSRLGGDGIRYREQLGEVNAFVADSIQGVRDTVAFGYEKRRARELWERGATMQVGQEKLYGADATQRALAEIFITVGILASAWVGVELALAGEISMLTDLPAVIAVSVVGFYVSVGMANNYTDFRVSMIAARRLFAMMDQPPAVVDREQGAVTAGVEASIHFENVHFEYDADDALWSRQKKVFDGFSLDVGKGRHVALVGPSGTGKSTVVNLLLRQWDPQSGSIRIGNRPLKDFTLFELQKFFAVVSQRSYIFNETIRENIRIGRHDATQEEIEAAARGAGLADWIATLPDGYDTACGERGSKISGGQRQRVAIARAILKNAPIVLLDEATSSLDIETELGVMRAVRHLCQGRTTLTIAHRLSTIMDSDEILVMLEGRIAERGTHQQLLERGGWYARMFEIQKDEVDATLVQA